MHGKVTDEDPTFIEVFRAVHAVWRRREGGGKEGGSEGRREGGRDDGEKLEENVHRAL